MLCCKKPARAQAGEMAEWLKAHAWKACLGETLTWVRIPLSPPCNFCFQFPAESDCRSVHTSSKRSCLPIAAAARCMVCNVTPVFLGSSRRSSARLLVCIRSAIADLVRLSFSIAALIWSAKICFSACSSQVSRVPSSPCFLLHFLHAFESQFHVLGRRLPRLLDEAVKQHHAPTDNAENYPAYFSVCQVAAHLPKPVSKAAAIRHSDRPAKLDLLHIPTD